ncbi:hypothetical protein ASF92_09235 [Pedobacter sp. Leaf176]|nr:hypothetical protein ASF92_09235 [Pedobacter sp. Leaf176]
MNKMIRNFQFFLSRRNSYCASIHFNMHQKLRLLIILIVVSQFLLHLGAMGAYGFHQDELLYITLGEHLSWGYRETPPMIALISRFSTLIFGDSMLGLRIIPALFASFTVYLTGLITARLGGKHLAVFAACSTVAFSPAFLASGGLLVPQIFDVFCWSLCCYLIICVIQNPKPILPVLLGIAIGAGILTKYTILIYIGAVFASLMLNRENRKIFNRSAILNTFSTAFLIVLPHLFWQFQNGFPALMHLDELKETQLIHLSRLDFIIQQLLSNGTGVFLWLAGLFAIWQYKELRPYRFIPLAFLLVNIILIILKGKPYYAFGAYPALFALGAIFVERTIEHYQNAPRWAILVVLLIPNLLLAPVVLPYLAVEKSSKVFQWVQSNLKLDFPLRWEDQKIHIINQNFADMVGWQEMAIKTSKMYISMPPKERNATIIFAEGYGAAAAFTYFAKRYPLPPVVSLSSSFAMWAPENLRVKHILFFSSENMPTIPDKKYIKFGVIENPYSRIYKRGIYLSSHVKHTTLKWYASKWSQRRFASFDLKTNISLNGWF